MSIPQPRAELKKRIDTLVNAYLPTLLSFRRDLHAHPELSWEEERTVGQIEAQLQALGVSFYRSVGTGVVVDIPGDSTLPRVIYRGDIDALPIVDTKDPTSTPYASQNSGICHACGHDVHSTIALAVTHVIHALQSELRAPVRIIFQPAEEVLPSGAAAMADAGDLNGASAGLALHVDPSRDVGEVGWLTGPITSATDLFDLRIRGKAGHSARPQLAHDAIAAAAAITQEIYGLARRTINPLHTAVLSVGQIDGGVAPNVVSASARLRGTIRTLHLDDRFSLHEAFTEMAKATAAVYGCEVDVTLTLGAPPVRNDAELAVLVTTSASDVLGAEKVHPLTHPSTGAEDFGVFSDHMRTFMLRLGCATPGEPRRHLHEEGFDLDERSIALGARIMARAVLALSQAALPSSSGSGAVNK